jgi:uncharacterized protein (DUF488 family)
MTTTRFYTIGYEGLILDAFVALLGQHGIEQIIDIRRLPLSRKPGFSKRGMAAALEAAGIGYTHLAALGTPKELRDAVRSTRDYDAFFAAIEREIEGQHEALDAAHALIVRRPSALLCVEADPRHCHRLTVADQLVRRADGALAVEHLRF